MKRWNGNRTQQEAAHITSGRSAVAPRPQEGWVNSYLTLESRETATRAYAPMPPTIGPVAARRRSWLFSGTAPTRSSVVTLAGRAVDVTEDEVGVVELHLAQYDGRP